MSADTLQPAQRLVDNENAVSSVFGAETLFSGRPVLMGLLISIIMVSLVLIVVGIFATLRIRNHRHIIELPHPPNDPQYHQQQSGTTGGTVFGEEDSADCCCGDDCCDEVVLTTSVQQRHQFTLTAITPDANKGTPDIIPCIGYMGQNDLDKGHIHYGNGSEY